MKTSHALARRQPASHVLERIRRGAGVALLAWLLPGGVAAQAEPSPLPDVPSELARVVDHADRGELEIVVGPVALEAGGAHVRLPIQLVEVPVDGWLHGFEWELRDGEGRPLPDELLHHVNLIDPDARELFAPVSRRVVAAGRETGRQALPRLLGYPLEAGTRFLIVSMFANVTDHDILDAHLHVRLSYSANRRVRPFTVYPFYMDVMGLVSEHKDFPLPPGRTVRSWEARPAIDARILGIGGHVHDYATAIRLVDVEADRVIWEAEPHVDEEGRVEKVPTARLWWRGGVRIHRDRVYRIEVEYHNPTDEYAADGGMGAIGGAVLASRGAEWPPLDRASAAYVEDLRLTLEKPFRDHGHGHGHGHAGHEDPDRGERRHDGGGHGTHGSHED